MLNLRLLKLAIRLHEAIRKNQSEAPFNELSACMTSLQSRWEDLTAGMERTTTALDKGWKLGARSVVSEYRFCREDVAACLRDLSDATEKVLHPRPSHVTVMSLYEDLLDLEGSFVKLAWNREDLSVTTEPIVLEGQPLGPFEIHVPVENLGMAGSNEDFHVIATDPHPSAKRNDVVHPHVEDGTVCTGDGTAAISAAMADGRILDFFRLIHAVLTTYNGESAYVQLDHWDDQLLTCDDCGNDVADDNSYSCEVCSVVNCDSCIYHCDPCSSHICGACSMQCPDCEERRCKDCMRQCQKCESRCCRDCVTETGLCTACAEKQAKEGESDDNNPSSGEALVAADCAGGREEIQLQQTI